MQNRCPPRLDVLHGWSCPPGAPVAPPGADQSLPDGLPGVGEVFLEQLFHLSSEAGIFGYEVDPQLANRLLRLRFVDPTFDHQLSATTVFA